MTCEVIDFQNARARRATGQPVIDRSNVTQIPIRCPDLDARPVPVRGITQGDADEWISLEVYSADGIGTYLARGPSRAFLGRLVMTPDGRCGFYRGHFKLQNEMKMARVVLPERVLPQAFPLHEILLMPEGYQVPGSAA